MGYPLCRAHADLQAKHKELEAFTSETTLCGPYTERIKLCSPLQALMEEMKAALFRTQAA